eukprot:CAMPEP_0204595270 /NCGR_PEP_ID=MMETSP0661-20131031/52575_1 /ASSEMBLY_ACC=CAM_ASM_000606 /TAXON_ID=109239 /ORGANISM="Alexandrium margalefi, Strain AMGDE01CS-322" /LENGTH=57 /DNA_ID=CAMNT_0051605773 /DNA_START=17 /DNA_END=187 /DNA_ORIENTATION=-
MSAGGAQAENEQLSGLAPGHSAPHSGVSLQDRFVCTWVRAMRTRRTRPPERVHTSEC